MTPKQTAFVAEYLVDLNATQAAIRAGYSVRTAQQIAAENLRKPVIAAALAKAQQQRLDRVQVTADEVLRLLRRRAHASLKQVARWGVKKVAIAFDDEGKRLTGADIGDAVMVQTVEQAFLEPFDSDDMSEDVAAGIAEIAIGKDGALRLKMHSQDGAVALLARHAGVAGKDGDERSSIQVNVFVDCPPAETRDQWLERVRRERLEQLPAPINERR